MMVSHKNSHGVDTSIAKCAHALIMIKGRVYTIHTDRVDRKLLKEW